MAAVLPLVLVWSLTQAVILVFFSLSHVNTLFILVEFQSTKIQMKIQFNTTTKHSVGQKPKLVTTENGSGLG